LNEVVARRLRDLDVQSIFGVMGDANMYIADSFHRLDGGRFISAANEGGAVQMAAGYAAVTGKVGVATVTHGAIANAVSALFDAVRGRYPVLVIAGDTARAEGFHLQNIPQREVVAPTGAAYRQVRTVDSAVVDLAAALHQAETERRPVVVEIPAEFQQAECTGEPMRATARATGELRPGREALEEAAGVILGSQRPLVIGGRGAGGPGAEESLLALARRIGAPVATTLRGKGLFGEDPCNIGIFGTLSHPVASETIVRSDCLIVFGAALTALTTLKGELLDGKRIVQVDTDPASFGRYYPVDMGMVGDAGVTARLLVELLDEVEAPVARFRSDELADRIAAWRAHDWTGTDEGALDLTGVLHRINQLVPVDRTLCIDGGRFSHEALRIMEVSHPSHYAHCLNVGHIGMSVGYGVGAATGRPDLPCLVIAGDGGFMLGGVAEFNTAVRQGLRLIVCLLNDGAYGAEYYRFVAQSLDPALTTFDWPGFADLAAALGGSGVRVSTWADFERVADLVTHGTGPLLIEVMLDRDAIPDPGEH